MGVNYRFSFGAILTVLLVHVHICQAQKQLSLGSFPTEHEEYLLGYYQDREYGKVVTKADSIIELGEDRGLSRYFQIKADALYFLNDVEGSLESYLKTIDLLVQYPLDTVYLIESYSHTGFCYEYLGQYLEAIPYYERALSITRAAGDLKESSNQLSHLGNLHANLGQYQEASQYLNESYQINFAAKDSTALAYDLVDLGDLKMVTGDYSTAIDYYRRGLQVKTTRAGNHNTHVIRLGKLSEAFLASGNIDSARKYDKQARTEALKISDELSLAKQSITWANILNRDEKYDSALLVGRKSFEFFSALDDNKHLVSAAFQLVDAHIAKSNLSRASRLLDEVVPVVRENRLIEDLAQVYLKRAEIRERSGDISGALEAYKRYEATKDTIQKRDKERAILILDQEYQTAQREQRIELLEANSQLAQVKLQQRQNGIIVLSAMMLVLILVGAYVYVTRAKKNRLQIQLLVSQINELRLKIKGMTKGGPDEAEELVKAMTESIDESLSDREFEILKFALTDLSNVEIAEKTFISVNTVKFHLKNIYEKLGVKNRKEALQLALKSFSNAA